MIAGGNPLERKVEVIDISESQDHTCQDLPYLAEDHKNMPVCTFVSGKNQTHKKELF